MCSFLVGRRSDLDHLIIACIQRSGDAADAAALACRIPALEHQQGGNAPFTGGALQLIQPTLITFQSGVIILPGQAPAHIQPRQDGHRRQAGQLGNRLHRAAGR